MKNPFAPIIIHPFVLSEANVAVMTQGYILTYKMCA